MTVAPYTVEELQARLLQVWADPSWSVPFRSAARMAAHPDVDTVAPRFVIRPADLSDDAVRAALTVCILTPGPGEVTTRDDILRRIAGPQSPTGH